MRALLFALPLAALIQPAAANTIPIPFAPPLGQRLSYRIEQERPAAGKPSRFVANRTIQFDRADAGYILTATLDSIDADAPPAGAEPYRAALGPLVGLQLRFRVDARGRIVGVDDLDRIWASVVAGLNSMKAAYPPDSDRGKAVQKVQALFDAMPPESRLALLAGEFQPLFLFAGGDVADGQGRGLKTVAGAPLARPVQVEGALTLAAQSADTLDLDETLAGDGVQVTVHYAVSRRTGLVERQTRSLTAGGRTLVETRSLARP